MTSDLNFSLSITYVTMLFLAINGCISIKFPIPHLLPTLKACQGEPLTSGAQALPARKNGHKVSISVVIITKKKKCIMPGEFR